MLSRVLLFVCAAALVANGCNVLGSSPAATPTVEPTSVPTAVATPTRAAAAPTATAAPKPTATSEATQSNTVWVGNTDGEGVYLRKTPLMSDHLAAYPDGTPLTIVGDDVDGDGHHWKHVKTPDGVEGYVPSEYTTAVQPEP
jgi:hypothetical protein